MKTIQCETQEKRIKQVDVDAVVQRISAYGVLVKDGAVLVIKTHSDNWELPGGTPEPGESLQQALERELMEEVGITVSDSEPFYIRESFYCSPSNKVYHSLQFYYKVESADTPRASAEAKEHAFVPLTELIKENTNTSTYLAIAHLNSEATVFEGWDPSHQAIL